MPFTLSVDLSVNPNTVSRACACGRGPRHARPRRPAHRPLARLTEAVPSTSVPSNPCWSESCSTRWPSPRSWPPLPSGRPPAHAAPAGRRPPRAPGDRARRRPRPGGLLGRRRHRARGARDDSAPLAQRDGPEGHERPPRPGRPAAPGPRRRRRRRLRRLRARGAARCRAGPAWSPPSRARSSRLQNEGLFAMKEGDEWYAFTQFEPISARRAFPCFDEPSYKIPWQVTLRVPHGQRRPVERPRGLDDSGRGPRRRALRADAAAAELPRRRSRSGRSRWWTWAPRAATATPTRLVVPKGRGGDTAWARESTPTAPGAPRGLLRPAVPLREARPGRDPRRGLRHGAPRPRDLRHGADGAAPEKEESIASPARLGRACARTSSPTSGSATW